MKLRGHKAIVTGGSRGIGYAIAKKLHELGAEVIITGKSPDKLKAAEEQLGVYSLAWDIGDLSLMQANFNHCVKLLGGCDILVNNAGVLTSAHEWGMSMLNLTENEWDRVMNTNIKGAYFMMQTAASYMVENHILGNILNISSVAALEPINGPYGVSKAGVFGLTRGWGRNLAPLGIVVNGIAPGPTATGMLAWKEGDSLEYKQAPTGNFETPDEIAELAAFLLSREGSNIIGHTVVADGAYSVR